MKTLLARLKACRRLTTGFLALFRRRPAEPRCWAWGEDRVGWRELTPDEQAEQYYRLSRGARQRWLAPRERPRWRE